MSITDEIRWDLRAACRGLDPDIFFPTDGDWDAILSAKAICESCSVRDECLELALTANIREGIWGGLDEAERRARRRSVLRRRHRESVTGQGSFPLTGSTFGT